MKRFLPFVMLWVLSHQAVGQLKDITLEDIWSKYSFQPASVEAYHPMPDGETYVQFENVSNQQLQNLAVYNYATGKQTRVLVTGAELDEKLKVAKGNVDLDGLIWNAACTKFLVPTSVEPIYRHSTVADHFVYDLATKKVTQLSANGKQQEPTFSPDGNKVAFVRANNLFVKNLETGIETQVTKDGERNKIINGIPDWVYEEEFSFSRAFEWSPDSRRVAWIRFDESEVPEYTVQYFTGLYPENYTYKYPKVGEKNSVVSVWIQDVSSLTESGASTNPVKVELGNDEFYIPRLDWTKDPNKLCVTRMNRFQNKLEFLTADATTGKTNVIYTEENKYYIELSDALTFLQDGSFIWTSMKDGFNHVYHFDASGKQLHQVTSGKWDVMELYGVDKSGKKIFYQSAEVSPLQRHVYCVNIDGSNKKQLTPRNGTNDASFNESFTYFLLSNSAANSPAEYFICKNDGKVVRTLETNDALKKKRSEYKISQKEFFSFKTEDGLELNGWMMKPSNFDATKKYPVFMWVYGGPGSQQVLDQYSGTNDLNFNYLCQKGYVVACVDNRGTGARGEEFMKSNYLQLGKYETQDQISAARYLGSLPYVDKARIGIAGWSYGAFVSSLCMGLGGTTFKTGVAVAPVSDWRFYDTIYTERYMRTQKENNDGFTNNSPLKHAPNIKGNYLLIHGLADDNVHYQNTAELLKALYKANVKFTQMTFPDKNHGIYGGNTRFYLYTQVWDYVTANL